MHLDHYRNDDEREHQGTPALTPEFLAYLLYLDVDRRVVRGRRSAKLKLGKVLGIEYLPAATFDDAMDSIKRHPDRETIEREFCKLVIDGEPGDRNED